ncbi:MAG: DUF721 domain-containing protein [Actinomycetota bacterium]|nr:DUF721 domain-containing protein [Actinomycetota bacterium]
MYRIAEILGKVLREEGASGMKELLTIKNRWVDMVGEPLASKTAPIRLDDKKLYIRSESHAWSQELHYEKERIKSVIEKETGVEIEDLVVRKVNLG